MTNKYAGKVNAAPFPADINWLNSSRPLSLGDFNGKLLILDFWAYSCINCMHAIPVLRKLERQYPEEIAVVGVHTAKFDEERATEHIEQAIMRYGVSHPVINDADKRVWDSYDVRAWPTLVFIDPTGKVVGRIEGELTYQDGVTLIDEMLTEFRTTGTLRPSPGCHLEPSDRLGVLRYPGKVVADEENERLFIADSGHNRILMVDLHGEIQTIIGSGHEGLADGVLEEAEFNHPQGMALYSETLFVADTNNHCLRVVDLEVGTVETIAGTGIKAEGRVEGGLALEVTLCSPWDIALAGRSLHIAMAGSHQIWTMNLDTHIVQAMVGTGVENILDGPPEQALFAQPSGLAVDEDGVIYVADSETSSIRAADMFSAHHVSTLVGAGLFDFGDVDGEASVARLQHPLGIAYEGGTVLIADTYNHKIKRLGTDSLRVSTLAGNGLPGHQDGPFTSAKFYEPGGLSIGGSTIYVADTNNHAVRALDLETAMVRTLTVDF